MIDIVKVVSTASVVFVLGSSGLAAETVVTGEAPSAIRSSEVRQIAFDWHANRADRPVSPLVQGRLVRQARRSGILGHGWNCSPAGSGSGSDCVLR